MDAFARVLAQPGSTEARRVLERAWRAQGNAQAELIEKQLAYRELERTNKTNTAAAKAIDAAIDHLVERNGRAWAGGVAELVDEYRFRRGLVAQVRMSGAQFLAHAAKLFELAPIQHATLEDPLDIGALADSPYLAKLGSLAIERRWDAFGDHQAARLAGSRHAAGLRWLSLYANAIGEAGVEALAASPYLEKVLYLSLDENPANPTPTIDEEGGQRIVHRPPLAAELERSYGKRPWLTGPSATMGWPPDRDDCVVVG
ncbi:MAG: hypothetical protein KF773_27740 [Deltaproteobacteria bacterium]|nr:hypothetical protein [Deltaproteobacteria bacterium]